MKPIIIAILFLATLLAEALQIPITDTQGRTIHVEVISMVGEKVAVSKTDGQRVEIPWNTLTKGSREAILEELDQRQAAKEKAEADKPKGIIVTHLITKLVNGKFRYFFRIHNHDATAWTGSATITLLNTQPGVKNGEEKFVSAKPMGPGLASVVYFEARTGPAAVHGDWSVAGFSYEIKDGAGKLQSTGKGSLVPKTEGF
jgi:hypothetical protein